MTGKIKTAGPALLALTALLLTACGSEQKPSEPPPIEDTAFRDMNRPMDKARAVEGTLQQQKENMDRQLQQNENPAAE
jgi:hypothetical protein